MCALLLLSVSILFSLLETFDSELTNATSQVDFFPDDLDASVPKKIMWYLSQMTYQTQLLLVLYFVLKVATDGAWLRTYFMIVAPACLAVNAQYFILLYPSKLDKNPLLDIYELSFQSLLPHLLDTIFIVLETLTMHKFPASSMLFHFIYIMMAGGVVFINYAYRKVWSYGSVFDMTTSAGWVNFLKTSAITQTFAIVLFTINKFAGTFQTY